MKKVLVLGILLAAVSHPAHAQSREELVDELDIFAVAYLDTLQPLSIRDNAEYCGLFGYDASGTLAATEPRRGTVDSCEPADAPPGFDVVASYHTHGAYSRDADTEVPSVDDMLADFDEGIDGYIATPGGRVWLNYLDEEVSFQLCGAGCIHTDPNYRPCPAFPPAAEYTIESLEARADRDTGEC